MSEATATQAAPTARLQQMFEENVVPKLASEKGLTNPLSQPRIVKAVVNVGVNCTRGPAQPWKQHETTTLRPHRHRLKDIYDPKQQQTGRGNI